MIVKQIIDEDCINYKKTSMIIGCPKCSFKCDKEYGSNICQNSNLSKADDIQINIEDIIERYRKNEFTSAIILAGLEPMDSWYEILCLINYIRKEYHILDDIVIYTGYNKSEIPEEIAQLKRFKNIIIKYGRYIPNQKPHYDEVLGVELASNNQYAEKIS